MKGPKGGQEVPTGATGSQAAASARRHRHQLAGPGSGCFERLTLRRCSAPAARSPHGLISVPALMGITQYNVAHGPNVSGHYLESVGGSYFQRNYRSNRQE